MVSRLEATNAALAAAIAQFSEDDGKRLALAAADMVLSETAQSPDRDELNLASLVEDLDAVAWDLQDQDDPGYSAAFVRARAMNALLCAVRGDVEDAFYEALHATADPGSVTSLVLGA